MSAEAEKGLSFSNALLWLSAAPSDLVSTVISDKFCCNGS